MENEYTFQYRKYFREKKEEIFVLRVFFWNVNRYWMSEGAILELR